MINRFSTVNGIIYFVYYSIDSHVTNKNTHIQLYLCNFPTYPGPVTDRLAQDGAGSYRIAQAPGSHNFEYLLGDTPVNFWKVLKK